jgi:Uma2 family endonuclease
MAVSQRWTITDLEMFPQPLEDKRYEIIDGELYVSTQPSYEHQVVCLQIGRLLGDWSDRESAGQVVPAPGVVFSDDEAVAPDLAWVRKDRLPLILGEDRRFHDAPDLMIEVLSPGASNERRDRQAKLGLYSRRGVREYWIVDWRKRSVEVFRRENAALQAVATLYEEDSLESPLLPGFSCAVARLFAGLT